MISKTIIWTTVSMLLISLMFTGCASMKRKEAARTEDVLIAAGFTSKKPSTSEEWNRFMALEPLKMIQTKKDGEIIYVYPDPYYCMCSYVGNEKQFAEFKRLSLLKQISENNLQAARMWETRPPYGPFCDGYWWW